MRDLKLNGALFEPRQEFLGIKCEIAAQKFMRAGWRAIHVLGKFNPDQPRDDQGRWTDTGGGDGTAGSDGELILTGSGGYPIDMLEEEGLGGHAIQAGEFHTVAKSRQG